MLFGRPLASEEEIGERLSKTKALAIFSSDAISSSAYATEEILRALLLAGIGFAALNLALPISIAIALLLAVVAISYRQVVHRLPDRRRLVLRLEGELRPPRVAHRGVGAPHRLHPDGRGLHLVCERAGHRGDPRPRRRSTSSSPLFMVASSRSRNLRGLRESGNIFAVPTYLFVGGALLMIVMGAYQIIVQGQGGQYPPLAEPRRRPDDGGHRAHACCARSLPARWR